MAQCNRHRPQGQPPQGGTTQASFSPPPQDPPMKRWPHPIPPNQTPPSWRTEEPTVQYVRCTLAYQNQLLADIKSLLQQLVQQQTSASNTQN